MQSLVSVISYENAFNLHELNLSYCFFSQFQQLMEGEERELSSTIREN